MLKGKRENGGLGAEAPEKFLLATPFRLLQNTFSASSSIPGFLEILTPTQKYNVCLKVISGYLKSKMPLQQYKRQHKG